MFKKIQKYLLLNHPSLWNIKLIPLAFFALLFHSTFFLIGFSQGAIDFSETNDNYTSDTNDIVLIFFSVLISILTLIIWCVYYFKNNSLKSYYPKSNFSLFKEWLLILFSCLLIVTFLVSYFYGKETRIRSKYSQTEAQKRCEILAMGSFFIDGSYSYYSPDIAAEVVVDTAATAVTVDSVIANKTATNNYYFFYKGKKYSYNSLINKNMNSYSFFDKNTDSLYKEKIKTWLVTNQKDSILNLFTKYLAIAKEHNLKASIDAKKWLDLVYDYPNFENYKIIGSEEKDVYYPDNTNNSTIDTTQQYLTIATDGTRFLHNRNYVPEKNLNHSYSIISDSYIRPTISWQSFLFPLYIALGLSLLLFSFRVTSGKNWLIAVVSVGVLNILIGIMTAIFNSEYVYFISILAIFSGAFIYFLIVISRRKAKGISGITINAMLWILPAFGPLLYYIVLQIAREISGYNDDFAKSRDIVYPLITYFQEPNVIFNLFYANILFVILILLFFSRKLKQWRGIAEN